MSAIKFNSKGNEMKVDDFIKDFVGENEVVTVSAVQLKKLLLDNELLLALVDEKENFINTQRRAISALKKQIELENTQKFRHIDLEA